MPGRILVVCCALAMAPASSQALDTVLLHAAGSLRGALTEVAQAFEARMRLKVRARFGANYGMTAASPGAYRLAMFVLSADGQRILARHGFAAPNFPP